MLVSVVNCGHMGATDRSPPGSCRDRQKVLVVAPLTRSGRSPNGCQGRGFVREARICKDGPHRGRRRTSVRDQAQSRYYVGVDVSKERLDVAFRPTSRRCWFPNDLGGIDGLVRRLLEERPALVVLEASGG